ncbi:MAG: 4Fe-4S binding protein [Candidatus Competibacteraceae bacterium]
MAFSDFAARVSVGVLLLFFGTLHWSWQLAGQPLLTGNLSSSEVVGLIPMADPLAVLQILFTGHLVQTEVLIGALLVLFGYGVLGGRVWCSWVCPVNMVTDLAGWLHLRRHSRCRASRSPSALRRAGADLGSIVADRRGCFRVDQPDRHGASGIAVRYRLGLDGGVGRVSVRFADLETRLVRPYSCPLGAFAWWVCGAVVAVSMPRPALIAKCAKVSTRNRRC